MDFRNLLKTALSALWANKLRSFLTTLGVIIGVGTVIAMTSIIDGINSYVYRVLGSVGSNTLYIQKYAWAIGPGVQMMEGSSKPRPDLKPEDAKAIAQLPEVEAVSLSQALFGPSGGGFNLSHRLKRAFVFTLSGVDERYAEVGGLELERGRFFTSDDIFYKRRVCVLGATLVDKLFEGEDPVGADIRIQGRRFKVVGVLKRRGQLMGQDLDDVVLVPITTGKALFGGGAKGIFKRYRSPTILVKVKEGVPLEEAKEAVREVMRARHGLRFHEPDDFAINSQEMLLDLYKRLTGGIFLAMIGIASLALLVGGIGIMNIMLVAVTERTREIGIRMAVGATRAQILYQFLFEAVVLTTAGGLLGVLLGLGIGKLVDLLTPLPSSAPVWTIFLGLGFSAAVGLFFGIWPAYKASRLDPIEALRYE